MWKPMEILDTSMHWYSCPPQSSRGVSMCFFLQTNWLNISFGFPQVGKGIDFDPSQSQWVKLPALFQVPCIWKPSQCTSGATIAIWLKSEDGLETYEGILGTHDTSPNQETWNFYRNTAGFIRWYKLHTIWTKSNKLHQKHLFSLFRWNVKTSNKNYYVTTDPIPNGWFHVAVVLHGPTSGISLYINGTLSESDSDGTSGYSGPYGFSTGEVVLGRSYTQGDWNYGRGSLDELYFWTRPLSDSEIQNLYNDYDNNNNWS